MNFKYYTLPLIIIICIVFSCNKEQIKINNPEKAVPGNFSEIFEAFWNGMNYNYLYWDIDNQKINWDKIHGEYASKFKALNINKIGDLSIGKDYFSEITKNLSDGHFMITFNYPTISRDTIFPAKIRNLLKASSEVSIKQQTVDNPRLYFDSNSGYSAVDPNYSFKVLTATIKNKILYLHFNNFFVREVYENNASVKKAFDTFFESYNTSSISSIIIDLRNNSGGNVEDLNFFVGRFVDQRTMFGYLKYKQGNNRLDYSPSLNAYVVPIIPAKITKPIYLLQNSKTISMAEISILAFKRLPNVKTFGGSTWGAQGILVNNHSSYNGGSFKVADFMNIIASCAALRDVDNKSSEGLGIQADVTVPYTSPGTDNQLEHVINLALKK